MYFHLFPQTDDSKAAITLLFICRCSAVFGQQNLTIPVQSLALATGDAPGTGIEKKLILPYIRPVIH
jgi:hypothetical protein